MRHILELQMLSGSETLPFKPEQILDSIIVLCQTDDEKVLAVNYDSSELLVELEADLTKSQVICVEAILELHRGNCNIETQGVLVLNPEAPIAEWKYDHDSKDELNALSLNIMSFEGKRYKCKTPLICRPAMEGVLFCKRCAMLDKGTFSQIVLEEE